MESPKSPLEAWLRMSEGLIAGVHHSLNNRLAALSAVGQVIEADLPAAHPLAGALTKELQRLEASVATLRLLADGAEGPEPVQIESVLESAARLFSMHHSLRDLQLEVASGPTVLPLWIEPSTLLRAILLMMAVGGRRAAQGDRVVRIEVKGDEAAVEVSVRANGGTELEPDEGLRGVGAEGAAALLRGAGGDLEVQAGEGSILLRARLPTLPEVRRLEAAARRS